ncbi:MAG: hypothetical protein HOL13_06960 [Phycisphaerae bacterium]|nr:hypothetical protein [Phycisphaerae bacterium]
MNTAAFNSNKTPSTSLETPKRWRFSSAYKLQVLAEFDRCTKPGQRGLILRREGLYSSHIANWRRWAYPDQDHLESQKSPTANYTR